LRRPFFNANTRTCLAGPVSPRRSGIRCSRKQQKNKTRMPPPKLPPRTPAQSPSEFCASSTPVPLRPLVGFRARQRPGPCHACRRCIVPGRPVFTVNGCNSGRGAPLFRDMPAVGRGHAPAVARMRLAWRCLEAVPAMRPIWVARTHNLAKVAAVLIAHLPARSRLLLDTERQRTASRRRSSDLAGNSYDLGTAPCRRSGRRRYSGHQAMAGP